MNNEIQSQIIILIVVILIKHFEFEETLIASFSTEQEEEEEEEDSNTLLLSLLNQEQLNREEAIDLRRLSRSISQYWFNEICLNMPDFEFKRHFRLTRFTFEWLCCEIIPLLRRNSNEPGIIGLAWEQKIGAFLLLESVLDLLEKGLEWVNQLLVMH